MEKELIRSCLLPKDLHPAGIVLLGAGILSYSVGKDFFRNLTKVLSGYRYSFHPEFH
jgi:hypothetical protein